MFSAFIRLEVSRVPRVPSSNPLASSVLSNRQGDSLRTAGVARH